jgi:hypothetical protein
MHQHRILVALAGLLFSAFVGIANATTTGLLASDTDSYDGTVVSAGDGKLTMIENGETEEDVYDVAPTATIKLDGNPAKLEDLKKGMKVTITVTDNDDEIIVAISATSP